MSFAETLNSLVPVLLSERAGIAVPLVAYLIGVWVQRLSRGASLANPPLIGIIITALVALALPASAPEFHKSADALFGLVGPATVAFAIPLYRNRALIASSAREIIGIVAFGSCTALSTAAACALLLGLPRDLVLSVAPKSTTAAIAMGVAERVGGVASITVVVVILTGLTTAVSITFILDRLEVRDPRARGLTAGICGHALATARMFQIDQTMGAFSGLAIGLAGIATALAVPIFATLLWR
jgi:putative effector of murein hydrolase